MKKMYFYFLICILLLFSAGCSTTTNNEIYNKAYNVEVDIENIGDAFVPAIEIATESTLGVGVYAKVTIFDLYWEEAASGSCVVYDAKAVLKNGDIVNYDETLESDDVDYYEYKAITNAHVLDVAASSLKYVVYDGYTNREIEASVLGKDSIIDLAVLSFTDSSLIVPIKIANSDKINKGQIVLAVGNPNGYEYYSSATMGIVSFPKRYVEENGYTLEYIQHDAAINPGNSGGSLVNVNGELIGINTAKIVEDEIDSIGFAIPSNTVLKVLERLENNREIEKIKSRISGYSISKIKNSLIFENNVYPEEIYKLDNGVFINEVERNSVFKKTLQSGDVIIKINDKLLNSIEELEIYLLLVDSNEKFSLTVYRNGKYEVISYIL